MTTVTANEVALGIESFGDDDAPLVLLAGGTTMLSWPDALCERLAAGGRPGGRSDPRGRREATAAGPGAPPFTPPPPPPPPAAPSPPPRRRAPPPPGGRPRGGGGPPR